MLCSRIKQHGCGNQHKMLCSPNSKHCSRVTKPRLYDPSVCTKVTADCSSYGLGAVLSQKSEGGTWHPVAYASRSLSSTEKRYEQVEKEALASAWACNHFEDYLIDLKFILGDWPQAFSGTPWYQVPGWAASSHTANENVPQVQLCSCSRSRQRVVHRWHSLSSPWKNVFLR